jgi:hypothetical protein
LISGQVYPRRVKYIYTLFNFFFRHEGNQPAQHLIDGFGIGEIGLHIFVEKYRARFFDDGYPEPDFEQTLFEQNTLLYCGRKKPKGKDLTDFEKYHNRLIAKFRPSIESLFNWINEKTQIQKAGKVRSTGGLMLHGWGKLAVAFFLLVFNY